MIAVYRMQVLLFSFVVFSFSFQQTFDRLEFGKVGIYHNPNIHAWIICGGFVW